MSKMTKIDGYNLVKSLRQTLNDSLQNRLEEGAAFDLLPEIGEAEILQEHVRRDEMEADWTLMGEAEKDIVIRLKELGRQLGSDPGSYDNGVMELVFKNKQAVEQYADALDGDNDVYGYEISAYCEDLVHGYREDDEVDIDNILFDGKFEFEIVVYLNPEVVQYAPEELELSDEDGDGYSDQMIDDENGVIMEVRRRIKVNFRGKRRVKMQCRAGFKWDATKKACVKITGAEVAKKRLSMRKATRTKKAKGQTFKVRVLRKTRKAKRFRKSMGLK